MGDGSTVWQSDTTQLEYWSYRVCSACWPSASRQHGSRSISWSRTISIRVRTSCLVSRREELYRVSALPMRVCYGSNPPAVCMRFGDAGPRLIRHSSKRSPVSAGESTAFAGHEEVAALMERLISLLPVTSKQVEEGSWTVSPDTEDDIIRVGSWDAWQLDESAPPEDVIAEEAIIVKPK